MKILVRVFLAIAALCFASSSYAMNLREKALRNIREKNAVIKNINDLYVVHWECPISEEELIEAFNNHSIINILFNGDLQSLTAALYKTTFSVDKNNRNILHFLMCIPDPWKKAEIIMSYVKKNRININAQDKYGRTPFHYAVLYANITGVIILQKLNANLWVLDFCKKSAVDYFADCLIHNESHFKILLNSMSEYISRTKKNRYRVKNRHAGSLDLWLMSLLSFGASL
jgi:ankyrin repeat protein